MRERAGNFVWTRVAHALLWPRTRTNAEIRRFASRWQPSRILEIGSGRPAGHRNPYSAAALFPDATFVPSDIYPEYGHRVIDVTKDDLSGFDTILCVHVLEHLKNPQSAIDNIWKALPNEGIAFFVVPFLYPLHDEPQDFARYTEHALREMMSDFGAFEIRQSGWRRLPVLYSVTAVKLL